MRLREATRLSERLYNGAIPGTHHHEKCSRCGIEPIGKGFIVRTLMAHPYERGVLVHADLIGDTRNARTVRYFLAEDGSIREAPRLTFVLEDMADGAH